MFRKVLFASATAAFLLFGGAAVNAQEVDVRTQVYQPSQNTTQLASWGHRGHRHHHHYRGRSNYGYRGHHGRSYYRPSYRYGYRPYYRSYRGYSPYRGRSGVYFGLRF